MAKPYTQVMSQDGRIIRTFESDVANEELEWHKDRHPRRVRVLNGKGWRLQLETGLPFEMLEGDTYEIPSYSWHRVLKGSGHLIVEITEI